MPVILVVEPDHSVVERITGALGVTGWQVRAVATVHEALEATASEAPLLFVVSTEVEGAVDLLDPFARRHGGPGTIALVPVGSNSGVGLHADEVVTKPFGDPDLREAVERTLQRPSRRPATPPAANEAPKFTSQDIFGDLVADLDDAVRTVAPPPGAPTPKPLPRSSGDSVIDRKLEETLSGILGITSTTKPAPPPPRPVEAPRRATGSDVDARLSRALSDLDIPVSRKPIAPPSASPAPRTAAEPEPRPTAPRRPVELDFSLLDELTKGGRRPAPPTIAPVLPAAPETVAFEAWDLTPSGLKPMGVPPPVAPVVPAGVTPEAAPEAAPVAEEPPPPPPAVPLHVEVAAGQRFGQYLLLEKIGVGGMAEVWKARSQGVEGFQKTVAIKRILPHLTDSADFVNMFVDEAKLAAQLAHDNIIQIFDLGKIGADYYMAMEYVEGENLRAILNKARERGEPIPPAIALTIALRLAAALGYAHHKRDFEGQELGLVHRDVSPQNVLVSLEGNVKLCDFGIVKAVARTGHTQMGALKGKLQYMSPEQAWGRPVDQRSDLFSVGVLLFEMLTGRRLFTGDSEMQLLEAVRDCRIQAPSEANPDIPLAVDLVVAKALARNPADRYQSAEELIQGLQGLLARMQPMPGIRDLVAYMRALFRGGAEPELPHFLPAPEAPIPAPTGFVPVAEPLAPTLVFEAEPELEPELEPVADSEPEVVVEAEPLDEVRLEPFESYLPEPAPLLPPADEPVVAAPEPNATIAMAIPRRLTETMPMRPAPSEVVEVTPVAPIAGVAFEEGSKGRSWLFAAIVAALVLGGGVAWYLTKPPRPPVGTEISPPALEAPADGEVAVPPLPAPAEGENAVPGGEAQDATSTTSVPIPGDDLDRAVDERLAGKEDELRRQFEAERKRLQQRIDAADTPAGTAPGVAPPAAPAVETPPPAAPPTVETPPAANPAPVEATPTPRTPAPLEPTSSPPPPEPAPTPSVRLGDLVSMGPGVTPPQLVTFSKPQYPPLARKLRVTGEVVVAVLVDENGAVQEVRMQKGVSQNVGINEAALEAARSARYKPATKEGVRVKMWSTLKIPFLL